MLRADSAKMQWDSGKKRWHVDIHVGAEVIKRPLLECSEATADQELRARALEIAKDDGYDLDAARVSIVRGQDLAVPTTVPGSSISVVAVPFARIQEHNTPVAVVEVPLCQFRAFWVCPVWRSR